MENTLLSRVSASRDRHPDERSKPLSHRTLKKRSKDRDNIDTGKGTDIDNINKADLCKS